MQKIRSMYKFFKTFSWLIVTLNAWNLNGQDFKWIKSYGSRYDGEITMDSHADKDEGSTILVHRYFPTTNAPDTVFYDTFKFPQKPVNRQFTAYLTKLDKFGNVKRSILLGNYQTQSFCVDDSGFYYVIGHLYDTFTFKVGNASMRSSNGFQVFLKYDQNFNLIWAKQHKNAKSLSYGKISYSNGRLLYIARGNNIGGVYGELSKNGALLWDKAIGDFSFFIYGITCIKNNFYIAGLKAPPQADNYINGDTFSTGSGFVIRLDSAGNYIKGFNLKSKKWLSINTIATDGKQLFIGGQYGDTVKWGNRKIAPEFPGIGYTWGGCEMFMASLSFDLKPGWFLRPKQINKLSGSGNILYNAYSDSFIYWGGNLGIPIIVNGDTIKGLNMILKTDLIGNIMWATSGGTASGTANSISALAGKAVYVGGSFNNTLQFGNKSTVSRGDYDAFITKISDNAIIRGRVKSGPYCAGDTIKIPYTKIGVYDTSNQFIAQLSDENGNFNGNEIELGRLNSDTNGSIVGKLPFFQVKTSQKYRIRILSTSPVVQSYYKADTLRLLIYSRDKAYPGKDTLICKGDSVNLTTYGGTKWKWSPGARLKDSTARETSAWPDKTTRYQIIIADSSGCGAADTAYKTIFVRKDLKISIRSSTDSGICKGGRVQLIANFEGGDSSNYNWNWVGIESSGVQTSLKSGKKQLSDTIIYQFPSNENDSINVYVFLSDNCTPKSKLSFKTLHLKKTKTITSFQHNDTAICSGKSLPIIAKFTGGEAEMLNWNWQEKNIAAQWLNKTSSSNQESDTFNYTLPLNWKGQKQIRVILTDQCSGLNDTTVFRLTPRDTLQLALSGADTSVCKGQSIVYKALGKDGYKQGYQYTWIDIATGDTLSQTDSLKITTITTQNIQVKLSDGCMPKSISRSFKINVFSSLKASITSPTKDSTLCYGRNLIALSSASGGKGKDYTYQWLLDNQAIGNQDSVHLQTTNYFNQNATKTLSLILKDGCTKTPDTARLNISVLAPIKTAITGLDSMCYGQSALLKAIASGGKGNYSFQWLDQNNVGQGNTDSLRILNNENTQKTISRKVIVNDACSNSDVQSFTTVLLPPLKLELKTQDTCISSSTQLTALGTGGKSNKYIFKWWKENTFLTSGPNSTLNILAQNALYRAVLSDACSQTSDTASLQVYTKALLAISANKTCLGDTSILKAHLLNNSPVSNYNWLIDQVAYTSADSIFKYQFQTTGVHQLKIKAGIGQCVGTDSLTVNVIEKPKAAFDFTHLPNTNTGIPFQFNDRSLLASSWTWTFGTYGQSNNKNPKFNFPDSGFVRIKLRVGKQNTCFDSIERFIPIYERLDFYFPDAISMDENGINDVFGLSPGQYPFVKTYHLYIYNRWGEKVFDSDVKEETWNSSRTLQGVYVYVVVIKDIYDVTRTIKGTVTVLK